VRLPAWRAASGPRPPRRRSSVGRRSSRRRRGGAPTRTWRRWRRRTLGCRWRTTASRLVSTAGRCRSSAVPLLQRRLCYVRAAGRPPQALAVGLRQPGCCRCCRRRAGADGVAEAGGGGGQEGGGGGAEPGEVPGGHRARSAPPFLLGIGAPQSAVPESGCWQRRGRASEAAAARELTCRAGCGMHNAQRSMVLRRPPSTTAAPRPPAGSSTLHTQETASWAAPGGARDLGRPAAALGRGGCGGDAQPQAEAAVAAELHPSIVGVTLVLLKATQVRRGWGGRDTEQQRAAPGTPWPARGTSQRALRCVACQGKERRRSTHAGGQHRRDPRHAGAAPGRAAQGGGRRRLGRRAACSRDLQRRGGRAGAVHALRRPRARRLAGVARVSGSPMPPCGAACSCC
jgi:hypothetical protein